MAILKETFFSSHHIQQVKLQLFLARLYMDDQKFAAARPLLENNIEQYYMAMRLILNPDLEGRTKTHPKLLNLTKLMILNFYLICICNLNTDRLPEIWGSLNFATLLSSSYFELEDSLVKGIISFGEAFKLRIEPISNRETEFLDIMFGKIDSTFLMLEMNQRNQEDDDESEELVPKGQPDPITERLITKNCRRALRIVTKNEGEKKKFLVDYEYLKNSSSNNALRRESKKIQQKVGIKDIMRSITRAGSESHDKSHATGLQKCDSLAHVMNMNTSATEKSELPNEKVKMQSERYMGALAQTLFVLKPKRPPLRKIEVDTTFDISGMISNSADHKIDSQIAKNVLQPSFNSSRSQIAHSSYDKYSFITQDSKSVKTCFKKKSISIGKMSDSSKSSSRQKGLASMRNEKTRSPRTSGAIFSPRRWKTASSASRLSTRWSFERQPSRSTLQRQSR